MSFILPRRIQNLNTSNKKKHVEFFQRKVVGNKKCSVSFVLSAINKDTKITLKASMS